MRKKIKRLFEIGMITCRYLMSEQDLYYVSRVDFFFLNFIIRKQGGIFYSLHENCEQGGKLIKNS